MSETIDNEAIEKASRDARRLSETIGSLDFEMQIFNQFAQKLKKLKFRGLFWGFFGGALIGGILVVVASKPLVYMYLEASKEGSKLEGQLEKLGFVVHQDEKVIQIYGSKEISEAWTSRDGFNVIQINK